MIRVGKRGTVVIPAALRQAYNIKDGTMLAAEKKEEGILLRSVLVLPLERYASLHNTVAPENDERAVKEAQEIDPEEKQQIRSALSEAFGIWRDLPETGDEFVRSLRQSDQGRMEDLDLV
jgi:AbrB family looped-hinge helix DNA binding protein